MNLPIVQTDVPSGYIDLGSGNPGLDLLPMERIARAADRYFSAGDNRTLQYGAEQGNGYFISALAEFLTSGYGFSVDPAQLLVTTGATSALDLLCTLHTQAGDAIIVEEPSYFLALKIFADHQLKVYSIPLGQEGMDIDTLEKMLLTIQPKFVYTIPTFHNPASTTLSASRRKRLVNLAREYDFLVLADEVYHFLAFSQEPPPPLALFTDQTEQVISINSFSKIIAPGLRLGWMQAHPKIINRFVKCGFLDSGGGLNPFTSAIIRYLIESGDLNENICQLQDVLRERQQTMSDVLDRYLPEVQYQQPLGGYYFWVQIPERDTLELRKIIRDKKIDIRPGSLFSSQKGLFDYVRLSISYHNSGEIETGVRILAESIQES